MKKAGFSIFRFSALTTLAVIFMYCASVTEIHYLFVNHHTELNERCHNHLHTQTGHVDCNLCKIELSSYVNPQQPLNSADHSISTDLHVYQLQDVKLNFTQSSVSPRGPPAVA